MWSFGKVFFGIGVRMFLGRFVFLVLFVWREGFYSGFLVWDDIL